MDKNNRPHSREKTTVSGTADVRKSRQVNTGSRPVGNAAPRRNAPSGRGGFYPTNTNSRGSSAGSVRLSPKTLLIAAVVVIIAIVLLKSCGGSLPSDMAGDYLPAYNSAENAPSPNNGSLLSSGGTSGAFESASYDSADTTVSSAARAKRYIPVGNGRDEVTIMVYMCGTDLESKYGMATKDLQEMLGANISDKVNLIVGTGGCRAWKNNVVSSAVNQIYKVQRDGLYPLEKDFGSAAMTDPDNLTDFIGYCKTNYPADRNILIFWDHGGGSLQGYGYDEKNASASSMTLAKINSALQKADCVFDWIGFDACLMATLETALVCNSYADYMIASEESEPGTGWDYTGWLNTLSENTSVSTVELSEVIIDDFVKASTAENSRAQVTLSVVDLAELQGTVPDVFREFASSTKSLIESDDYKRVSDARAGVRQFAQSSKLNQVDLVDLADRIGTKESKALAQAVRDCVKYNKTTISRSYGLSIFFPYESLKSVSGAVSAYNAIGIDDEYTKCIQSFASLEYGGQISASSSQYAGPSGAGGDMLSALLGSYAGSASGASTSPVGSLLGSFMGSSGGASAGSSMDPAMLLGLLESFSGRSMPSGFEWVDTALIADNAQQIADNFVDPARITVTKKGGENVLALTEREWSLIQTVELNVFVDDGGGFIDLGLDNTFDWNDDGDLLLDFDGTWLTVNGKAVAYYLVDDTQDDSGNWITKGRIPALLNGEAVNLIVVFDEKHPAGTILGADPLYADGVTETQAKGSIEIVAGDRLEFLCDYYDYDGNWSSGYTLGESLVVGEDGFRIANMALSADSVSFCYRLTDIYGNHFWTPAF